MAKRTAQHATFVIDRTFDASPARVFAAWSDPTAKARWFKGPDAWQASEREQEFRVGGREKLRGSVAGAEPHTFESVYHDIVPNERIVYSYDMHIGDRRISVSLATIELKAVSGGTRLVVTEQGVFLDGYDDAGSRETGTRALLDQLEVSLRSS